MSTATIFPIIYKSIEAVLKRRGPSEKVNIPLSARVLLASSRALAFSVAVSLLFFPALLVLFAVTQRHDALGTLQRLGSLLGPTLVTVGAGLVLALPIALVAGLYLSEAASTRFRTRILPFLKAAHYIPTLVVAVFWASLDPSANLIVAFSLCFLPLLSWEFYRIFQNVAANIRQTALHLGATRGQLIKDLLLPLSARPLMSICWVMGARGLGEAVLPALLVGPDQTTTLAGLLLRQAPAEAAAGRFSSLALTALVLFFLIVVCKIVADRLVESSGWVRTSSASKTGRDSNDE